MLSKVKYNESKTQLKDVGTAPILVEGIDAVVTLNRADDKTLQARIDTTKDQLRAAPEYIYLGKEPPKGATPANPAGDPAQKP